MFKPKKVDKETQKMREEIERKSLKAKEEWERRQREASKLLDKEYVQKQLAIGKVQDEMLEQRQQKLISKTMDQIKKTELHAFRCKNCNTMVDMQNLTCPQCGQLYCQWCGSPMDMMNPGLCPRCQRPPMFTPAELVITKVEDLPPEDRFWEELPTCKKCGAAVQPDWPQCPICNAKLSPTAAPSSGESDGEWSEADASSAEDEAEAPGDKKDKKKKKGI
jgi:rubrerythrin